MGFFFRPKIIYNASRFSAELNHRAKTDDPAERWAKERDRGSTEKENNCPLTVGKDAPALSIRKLQSTAMTRCQVFAHHVAQVQKLSALSLGAELQENRCLPQC